MKWDWYPERSRRIQADGLKPTRKDFATRWWARRWIEALQRVGQANRLERGRTYARAGQVLEYEVAPGKVSARVQGSRKTPYEVTLSLKCMAEKEWSATLDAMAARASFAASLLAGAMPEDVEEAFEAAGTSLMPRRGDLETDCSCPDWANPCKHVAAVHYLLADAFDDDPFLMFRLRGRTAEEVMEGLRARRPAAAAPAAARVTEAPPAEEPLPADPDAFWRGSGGAPVLDFAAPATDGALLLRLGAPGGWTTTEEFHALLAPVMGHLAGRAREAAAGEGPAEVADGPPAATRSGPAPAVAGAPKARPRPTPKEPARPALPPEDLEALRLALQGRLTAKSLAGATGESPVRARDRIARLVEGGLLLKRGRTRGTTYSLTEAGKAALR